MTPLPARETQHVERLAYTRAQAAAALGMTSATFARRVLPLIETVEMPWGKQLVPIDELERLLAEHRRPAPTVAKVRAVGRRPTLPDGVVGRIATEHRAGKSLGQIARDLNADRVPTAQGGMQWWPSTVRVVLRGRAAADLAAADSRRRIDGLTSARAGGRDDGHARARVPSDDECGGGAPRPPAGCWPRACGRGRRARRSGGVSRVRGSLDCRGCGCRRSRACPTAAGRLSLGRLAVSTAIGSGPWSASTDGLP